jgi:hypothetical protein
MTVDVNSSSATPSIQPDISDVTICGDVSNVANISTAMCTESAVATSRSEVASSQYNATVDLSPLTTNPVGEVLSGAVIETIETRSAFGARGTKRVADISADHITVSTSNFYGKASSGCSAPRIKRQRRMPCRFQN